MQLQKQYQAETIDNVRVIRDRHTGLSRKFAFVRFPSIQAATTFLEHNHPSIELHGSSDNGEEQSSCVRISFGRERNDRTERSEREQTEGEWKCLDCGLPNYARRVECFKCRTPRTSAANSHQSGQGKPSDFRNTGDSDISPDSTPSQFLLFRGLESSVSEDLLAKGAAKLFRTDEVQGFDGDTYAKPGVNKIASTSAVAQAGAQPGTIRRVLLIKDRRSGDSWRYGFVEYMTVEVCCYPSSQVVPVIATDQEKDAQAALAKFNALERFTISSKPVLVSYVHAGIFVPELDAAAASEGVTFAASTNPSLQLKYWDEDAFVSELVVSTETTGRGDTAGLTSKTLSKGEGKSKKRKAENSSIETSKKAMPSTLQFWTNRHAELHGIARPAQDPGANNSDTSASAPPVQAVTAAAEAPPARSFADPVKNCCYLCSRQFKSAAEANKHERLSTLHQENLKNDALVSKASAKMGSLATDASGADMNSAAYRDRAKERRAAFVQPKKAPAQGQTAETRSRKVAAWPEVEEDATPARSKGAALLGKMGWTAGAGLGREGTGATAAINTELYAAGVGLGAEGGRIGDAVEEAARASRGDYAEFAVKTRDRARERFEKMT